MDLEFRRAVRRLSETTLCRPRSAERAMYDVQTLKFLAVEPGFGKRRGDTINNHPLHAAPRLPGRRGRARCPPPRPSGCQHQVRCRVGEWGFKVPVTEFEENLTAVRPDQLHPANAARPDGPYDGPDGAAAMKGKTLYKYTPQVGRRRFRHQRHSGGARPRPTWAISDLRQIRDQLRKNKAPYFRGGQLRRYRFDPVCPRPERTTRSTRNWIVPHENSPMLMGRMKGRGRAFMLLETNNVISFADLGRGPQRSLVGEAGILRRRSGLPGGY